jgi:hypothetical protein
MTKLRVASQQGVDWGNDEHVRQVCERDLGQDVILLDSYSVAYSNKSEDENTRAVSFSRVVHRIIRETGATVIVVDHSGFDDSRLRGASAKGQQADVVIHMKEARGWPGRGRPYEFTLKNEKASRFENPFDLSGALVDVGEDIELKWTSVDAVPAWYGLPVTEAVERPEESSSPQPEEAPVSVTERGVGDGSPVVPTADPTPQPMSHADLRRERAAAMSAIKEVFPDAQAI